MRFSAFKGILYGNRACSEYRFFPPLIASLTVKFRISAVIRFRVRNHGQVKGSIDLKKGAASHGGNLLYVETG